MENLKQLLLRCEVYLKEGEWDKLLEALSAITQEHIHELDPKTAEDCIRILNHLIEEGEGVRNKMAESLINIKRFKEGTIY
ncbi:MAG: hypothetical protein ACK4OF_07530 [Aquificaceae bacterium]